jgi:mannose-6-phosphate isomerase-like protein (cupin superfamily)
MKDRRGQHPVHYEDGVSLQEFYKPGSRFLGKQVVPPNNKLHDGSKSFMAPPMHIHLLQDEIFRVTQGEGIWYVRGQPPKHLKAGEEILIPQYVPHCFENVPGSTEPLHIDFTYDHSYREMEIRFFCNVFAYMDDCNKSGTPLSILQMCIFATDFWMPIDLNIPGPNIINLVASTLFTWTAAAIGYFIFGYKREYPEYYEKGEIETMLKSN